MDGKKIVVIGGTGFIGGAIRSFFNCVGTSSQKIANYKHLNILNYQELKEFVENTEAEVLVNSSGITNVDLCETETKKAFNLNGKAASMLAKICNSADKTLVHISSDAIFDGFTPPYREEAIANPLNVYGKSKLIGELGAIKYNALIIRISTPFDYCVSNGKKPFNCFVLESLLKGMNVNIAIDQVTTPTFAPDIPQAIDALIQHKKRGLFNLGSTVPISRYDFAMKFAESAGLDVSLIRPAKLKDLPLMAKRPLDTSLDSTKISKYFHITPLEKAIQYVSNQSMESLHHLNQK